MSHEIAESVLLCAVLFVSGCHHQHPVASKSSATDPLVLTANDCDISMIMRAVSARYAAEHQIVVEPLEVEGYTEWMTRISSEHGMGLQPADLNMAGVDVREIIQHWKVSAAVYQTYGGDLAYQLFPPVYPVEAFERLVESFESDGRLMLDPECRERLREHFASFERVAATNDPFATPYWHSPAAACPTK